MGIGTSLGAYYDDAHHHAAAAWDDAYETEENKSVLQKSVDKAVSGARNDSDSDLIRLPMETSSAPEGDRGAEITSDYMQQQMANSKDPGLIRSDSGEVVDYDYTDMRPNNIVADNFAVMGMMGGTGEADLPVRQTANNRVKDTFNALTYDTQLTPKEEVQFQDWKAKNAPKDSGADYDLRGAFKGGASPADNGHWPDTWKKPNHPTFSDQSQYAKDRPDLAGSWDGDFYVPPAK